MLLFLHKFVIVFIIVHLVTSDTLKTILKKCDSYYTPICFKYDIVLWIEKLSKQDRFEFIPGIQVIKDKYLNDKNNSLRSWNIQTQNESYLDTLLLKMLKNYVESHSIKLTFLPNIDDISETSRKKEKMTMTIGMLMMMVKGMMIGKAIIAIALLSLKAAITSAIALATSLVTGLKTISSNTPKQTMVEIVSKPIHHDYGTHGTIGSNSADSSSINGPYVW